MNLGEEMAQINKSYKKLEEILVIAQEKKNSRLVVASAEDKPVLEAVKFAYENGLVEPILVGDIEKIKEISKEINFKLEDKWLIKANSSKEAAEIAVLYIKEKKADILMKGLLKTATFLKAILNRENGIKKRRVLSHIALFELEYYHKLLAVTDAAMNIYPTLEEKVEIIKNGVEIFHKLNIELPKVAVLAAVEVVNSKMSASTDAALLAIMNKRNQITGAIIDGPLGLDNAISKEAAEHKKIESEVSGDCDILVTPDINSGNILYKSMSYIANGTVAAVLMGATAPIVLTSRSDSKESKLYSIALAASIS